MVLLVMLMLLLLLLLQLLLLLLLCSQNQSLMLRVFIAVGYCDTRRRLTPADGRGLSAVVVLVKGGIASHNRHDARARRSWARGRIGTGSRWRWLDHRQLIFIILNRTN